jgi:hypothetical protein
LLKKIRSDAWDCAALRVLKKIRSDEWNCEALRVLKKIRSDEWNCAVVVAVIKARDCLASFACWIVLRSCSFGIVSDGFARILCAGLLRES